MILIDLIYNLSVLVALSTLSGFINTRYDRNSALGKLLQGLLFGIVAIIGMLYPFELEEGVIFDGRSIVISLCTLFFGPLPGAISSIMAIAFRNYLGGGGALTGTLVITASFVIGYYFYFRRTKNKFNLSKINLYLFGVLSSAAMMALMLSLPSASILETYETITITVMLAYPIISLVIGKILLDQEENRNSIEKIKREESLFKTTLYSIGDAVITTDKNGKIQHMNPIAEKLTGYNEAEGKGKILTDVFKIINEVTRLDVENPVLKVLREKSIVGLANHTLLISKDGNEIPIADSGAPIIDEDGSIIGVVLVFRDQTDERLKEKEIRESEEKLQSIFRAAPIGIGVVVNRVFIEVNPRLCEMTGYQKEELIGKSSRMLYLTQEDYDFVGSEKYRQIASYGTGVVETRFVRKDGKLISILLASTPIEKDDLSKGVTFTALDISDRKIAEQELLNAKQNAEESEKKYRYLFENNPHPMMIYDTESFQIIDVNNTAVVKYGYSREEFINMPYINLCPQDEKEKVLRLIQSNRPDLQTTGPWKHVFKNGTEIIVEVSSHAINYQNKKARIIVANDVTEKVKAENELRKSEERWQFALEGPGDGVWDWNIKTNEVKFSRQWKAMLGYAEQEIINSLEEWKRLVHPHDLKSALDELEKHFKGETSFYQNEQRLLCKDGSYKWILDRGKVMDWSDDGSPLRMIGTHTDISKQKQIEEALRQSEEKFRSIVEGAPEPIFIQSDKKFAYVNPAFIELMGAKDSSELIGLPVMDRFHPDYHEEIRKRIQRLNEAKSHVKTMEMKYLRLDGSEVWVETTGEPIVFDGGNGALIFVRNINDRKIATEALKESEEKMRLIIEGTSFFFFYTQDVNGDITYISPTVEKITGYLPDEWLNQRHWFATNNPINDEARRRTHRHLKGELILEPLDLEIRHKNGSDILLEVFETPILKEGKVIGLQGIARDITANKKAEESLRLSEEKLRFLFENHSAVKLIICAETGDIYDANFAAANYYGWSRKELMQMNINQINILSRDDIAKEMERARKQKRIRFEFKHKRADGSIRDVEVFSSNIVIEGKEYLHSIVQDITEKKKAEEQLKQHRDHLEELVKLRTGELDEANKKLQVEIEKEKEVEKKLQLALEKEKELSELKSRFISTTSHEFRTPLTSVLSSVELIQRYGRKWTDEKLDYHTNKIKNSIEYLTNLLDDVLTISRSDSGKIVYDPVKVDLENILIELIDEARHNTVGTHKINFDLKLSKKEFLLDPKLIRFIITNLLSNAIKYSPKGGNIDVSVINAEKSIEIKMKDEGIGIPGEEIPFLFDPFHRANNTIEIPGTGLGLSIVKRSVDLHGGQIKIESEINKGTTFIIYLPIN